MVFLILGLVLHGTPRGFLNAVTKAVPTTAGVLVQFPLYAAMAAVLTRAEGRGGVTVSEHLADLFTSVGGGGGFAVVIALYTALLGLLVPSGGGKWLVEAPYVMQSATDVGMNLGWTVQIYNAAEALPNLVNPFFMLPLLAVLGVRARDLVGFTFLQFLFHLPVVLLLLWLLGMTFEFVPPVAP
jgi:short-chain fatty acids transporter